MALTAAVTNSYKTEILSGTHLSTDTYKFALFPSTATLNASTTAYSSTGEVTGTGYTAGGATLTGFAVTLDTATGVLTFSNPTWPSSTITARGGLLYNSTKANKSVAVVDFGSDVTSTAGTFTVQFPTANASTGLIRIA